MNQSIKKTGNGGKAQTEAIAVQLGAGARKPEGRPSTHTHFHNLLRTHFTADSYQFLQRMYTDAALS